MGNFFRDNDDLQYYVERGIDWEPLVRLTEDGFRYEDGFEDTEDAVEFYRDVMELVGRFVADEIDPHVQDIDEAGLTFEDGEVYFPEKLDEIFEQLKHLELHGLCVPRDLGGMNCPLLVYMLNTEMMARADVSISAHNGFHGGMAMALLAYSIDEGTTEFNEETRRIESTRFQEAIDEIMAGEAWASMDITEPGAGSDMAALRTKAEQDEEGNWFVTGQKIFITSGHGKYHVVIARTEEEDEDERAGLKGLSTFLVKTYEEDEDGERTRYADIGRIEHKMGHHASPTCQMNFEETPAELIGERGEGFRHMLLLMNNARVGVSFESIGLCEKAYRLAKEYASERESMGKTIDQHEMIADYLEEMRTDIQGMRALAMDAAYNEELSEKAKIALKRRGLDESTPEGRELIETEEEHKWKARKATPLLKYLAAEKAVEMSRCCLQIHGGVGYTKEYEAEKLVRDAVVMPIYEGTSQIQALMATKDAIGNILEDPQAFLKRLAQARWRSIAATDPHSKQLAKIQLASLRAQQHLISKTAVDKFKSVASEKPLSEWPVELLENWDPDRDFSYALLHAENLTRLMADEMICELLFKQGREHSDRWEVFERYAERAEPRARHLLDVITSTGERLLDKLHPNRDVPEAAE